MDGGGALLARWSRSSYHRSLDGYKVSDGPVQVSPLEAELAEQTTSRERLQVDLLAVQDKLDLLDPNAPAKAPSHDQVALEALDSKLKAKTKELQASNDKVSSLEDELHVLGMDRRALRKANDQLLCETKAQGAECAPLKKQISYDEKELANHRRVHDALVKRGEELMEAREQEGSTQGGSDSACEDSADGCEG